MTKHKTPAALGRTLPALLTLGAATLLGGAHGAQAQTTPAPDGVEPFTVAGSAGAAIEGIGSEFALVRDQAFTIRPNAPVGTTVIARYNLPPQGNATPGNFGFDSSSALFNMLVRYRSNGVRVVVRVMEKSLTNASRTEHNVFDSNDPESTLATKGGGFIDGDPVATAPDPDTTTAQSVWDQDGDGDSDSAPGGQPARFGAGAFYLQVELTKETANGDGFFTGAAVFQFQG